MQLTAAQRNALEGLQSTIARAAKSVRAATCDEIAADTPLARLEAMTQRLWAVQNAGIVIRGPLRNFYDALTDEQKARFRAEAPAARNAPCGADAADDRLIKQIGRTVRPNDEQKQSVTALTKAAGGMNHYLMAFCAQPTPEDPLSRLDAANGRLTAMNYAATSMEVALNQFGRIPHRRPTQAVRSAIALATCRRPAHAPRARLR